MSNNIFVELLTKPELFHRVAKSDNVLAEMRQIGRENGVELDVSAIAPRPATDIPAAKEWEIFSRVRFEYVRPFCKQPEPGQIAKVAPSMPDADRDHGLRSYFWAAISPDPTKMESLESQLANAPAGSLGAGLAAYYAANKHLHPGTKPSLFPPDYIVVHDLHHVLIGCRRRIRESLR